MYRHYIHPMQILNFFLIRKTTLLYLLHRQ